MSLTHNMETSARNCYMDGKQVFILFDPLGTLGLISTDYFITTNFLKLSPSLYLHAHFPTFYKCFLHVGPTEILSISSLHTLIYHFHAFTYVISFWE